MLYGSKGILSLSRHIQRRRDREGGQILILFCLSIIVILLSASIVIDLGLLRNDKARLQTALDAGALAAGQMLPANSSNIGTVTSTANQFVAVNYPGVASPAVSYRCLISYDSVRNRPRASDMPSVCNVSFPVTDAIWRCTDTVCWAPCDPIANPTDVCNTITLTDSATRDYGFGRVVGIDSGNTGATQSAVCTGRCGAAPVPLDTVVILDRTGSMGNNRNTPDSRGNRVADSDGTAGVRLGAHQVLSVFDPSLQRVALGLTGLSSPTEAAPSYGACLGTPEVNVRAMSWGGGVAYGSHSSNDNETTATIVREGVGAVNSTTSGTGLNLATPAGATPGETLVATLAVSGTSAPTITAAGWKRINATTNGSSSGITVASYYRTLAAAPDAAYTFTWSGGNQAAVGAIVRYSGVDTGSPVAAQSNPADRTGNSRNVISNAIGSGGANGNMLVGLYGIAASTTFTAPGDMREIIDAHPGSVAPTLEVADGPHSTQNKTATAGTSGQWAAHAFELRPGKIGSSGLSISRPNGTTAGSALVAAITVRPGNGTNVTAPSGWTLIARTNNGSDIGLATYWKVAGSGEPGSYTWSIGGGAFAAGTITRYTGVDTANPAGILDPAAAAARTGASGSLTAPSITTGQDYTQVVGVYASASTNSINPASGMSERSDYSFATGGLRLEISDDQLASAGPSGDKTASGGNAPWAAQLIGLRSEPVDTYSIDVNNPTALKSWIPVGFTGTDGDAPAFSTPGMRGHNEAYSTDGSPDRVVNQNTDIAQAIECYDKAASGFDGTNLATPIRMATKYLQTYGRPRVAQAIVIETDGYPQSCPSSLGSTICSYYTDSAARAAATAAKDAGIRVITIGYDGSQHGLTSQPGAIPMLADMASSKAGTSTCTAAENTDGDDFFCAPDADQLKSVFEFVAASLARGPHLIQMYAQPIVTAVAPSSGSVVGGYLVTVSGKYLSEAYSVTFGGASARILSVDDSQIVVQAPAGSVGKVDVQVSTPGGSSKNTAADDFTYTSP